MTDVIAHRGPDGEGFFVEGPVGLGHRRLAILDLSPAGQQPMLNESGSLALVHNGEIYNFQSIRAELETLGHRFKSKTDSEVIVHAYEQWGEHCLDRFNGMFAFAIWDRDSRQLFLARDRYGIKPIYWYHKHEFFVFASEIKAILLHPFVRRDVSYEALNEYFTFQNVFSDLTLFEGIRLLPPGNTLTIQQVPNALPRVKSYWNFPSARDACGLTQEACADRLYELFEQSVTRQLVSDVPVGAYLSGGMDSGSIVSITARHMPRLLTFTGGFDLSSASGLELGFDERSSAETLSNLSKTEHYEVVMHAGDMEWILPDLIWHLEDLRVGQSYPNYFVARLASRFVKVVLSGAGGDELFGGYPWRYYRGLNRGGRESYLRSYYAFWQRLVSDEDKPRLFNHDVQRRIKHHAAFDVFSSVFDRWEGDFRTNEDFINASLYFELKTFLHGLLVVEDKLSMANGLETRLPFLDDELVEFAVAIPPRYKLRNLGDAPRVDENVAGKRRLFELQSGEGKAVLRQAMSRLVPKEVTDRVKQGFSAPDASWFRGESIDYINRLLRNPKAMIYEFLSPAYVSEALDEHCSGRTNRRLFIWSLLSFEWWCKTFLAESPDGHEPRTGWEDRGLERHVGTSPSRPGIAPKTSRSDA